MIPKLRFPEFNDEWQVEKLGSVTKWASGGTPSKDNPKYWNGDIPWISASSMVGSEFDSSKRTVSAEGATKGTRIAHKGSVLLLVRGSMLFNAIPVGIASRDVAFNQDVKAITSGYVIQKYLLYFFQAMESALLSSVVGTGIGAGKLDTDYLLNLSIGIPSKEEQQKITDFITAVDDKIAALDKKTDLLKQYKQGLMQKIFSQEIRFKDDNGKDFPEWKIRALSEIMQESRVSGNKGNKAKKLTVKLWGLGVQAKNDQSGSEATQYYKRKAGQFIFSKLDFLNCAFGIIPVELDGYESTVDLPAFDLNAGYTAKFLLERVIQKDFYKRLGETADGSRKAKRIHADTFLSFEIIVPEYEEQQKIANFLTAIDDKINLVQNELEQAKQFKKALLQRMFVYYEKKF